MTVKLTSKEALIEAMRHITERLKTGEIISFSAVYEPTGIARVNVNYLHGPPPDDVLSDYTEEDE